MEAIQSKRGKPEIQAPFPARSPALVLDAFSWLPRDSGGTQRATSVTAPADFGGEIHKVSRNRAHTQVPLQARKLHVYGSGTPGGFWRDRVTEASAGPPSSPVRAATAAQSASRASPSAGAAAKARAQPARASGARFSCESNDQWHDRREGMNREEEGDGRLGKR